MREHKEDLINQVKQSYDLIAAHLSKKDKRLWTSSDSNTNDG